MSTGTLALRDYQSEAITAVEQAWADLTNRPAVVLPTGTGKTVVFAHLAHREVRSTGQRVLILVHRDELVTQTAAKLAQVDHTLTVGVVKAERNETDAEVIVASVQTLSRKRRMARFLTATYGEQSVGTVIVDEAHHAAAESYRFVLDQLGCFAAEPSMATRTLGVSATLARSDSRGLGDVWQEVVYTRDILWAILHEHLVDVRGKSVTLDGLDLGSVAKARGDFADGSLADALLAIDAGKTIATAYCEHAGDRQGIMFCPNVETCWQFAMDLNLTGVVAKVIVGSTPTDERRKVYREYEQGKVQVLVSCAVLTEGFDMPQAEVCVIARPTQSAPLFVQMVGRVLRPFPGKRDALVLDVVGATREHRLAALVDLSTEKIAEPKEGESLLQVAERTAEDHRVREAAHKAGQLAARDVDLFARSRSAWLRTPGGVWFIPTRDAMFFLWPSATEGFRVGRKATAGGKAEQLEDGLDLDLAMAWAEEHAGLEDPSISSRSASWRARNTPASDRQVEFARSLGIDVPAEPNKAEMSDLISTVIASQTFDRHLPKEQQA